MTNSNFRDQETILINDLPPLSNLYKGTGLSFNDNLCGVESERFFFSPDTQKPMTPQQSQAILRELAQKPDSIIAYEKNGITLTDDTPGAIIKTVTLPDVTYALELAGTFETATRPYNVKNADTMLKTLYQSEESLRQLAFSQQALVMSSSAIYPNVTLDDCEEQSVARERLVAELNCFKSLQNTAGLKTMLLATSSQISLSYPDEKTLNKQFIMGNFLAPLYYAVFSNTDELIGREKTNLSVPRAQWWLDHNQFAPRAGTTPFVYDTDCDVATEWPAYVQSVPMVYYMDQGKPVFGREKSFQDLQNENPNLGNLANYKLAQSLIWTDVRLCDAGDTGTRMEFRAADSGRQQPAGVTVMTLGLLGSEKSLQQTKDLLTDYGLYKDTETNRAIVTQARTRVPYDGLETNFGKGTLLDFIRDAMPIIQASPFTQDKTESYLQRGLEFVDWIARNGWTNTDQRLVARMERSLNGPAD